MTFTVLAVISIGSMTVGGLGDICRLRDSAGLLNLRISHLR